MRAGTLLQCAVLTLAMSRLSGAAGAQTGPASAPSSEPIPKNPDALMQLASRVNGLDGTEKEPWHLKATYTLADASGKTISTGAIEEYRSGPLRDRLTYTSGGKSQNTWLTSKGNFQSGDLEDVPWIVEAARNEILSPLPQPSALDQLTFHRKPHTSSGGSLQCLSGYRKGSEEANIAYPPPTYCLMEDKPIPRVDVTLAGHREAVRNNVVFFDGRYVPGVVQVEDRGKFMVEVHLDTIEVLKPGHEFLLTPQSNARLVLRRVEMAFGFSDSLLKRKPPEYPRAALAEGVQGTVAFEALIATDGRVARLDTAGGPPALEEAARKAVQQWVYKPYFIDGQPVEIKATIVLTFVMGPRRS